MFLDWFSIKYFLIANTIATNVVPFSITNSVPKLITEINNCSPVIIVKEIKR